MARVTMLGLGAMGSRMGRRLLQAGHTLTVWNRTRTDALLEAGAEWADNPRRAVASAEVAIAMVRDDEASCSVWLDADHGALAGLAADAIAVESSTLSVPSVLELHEAFALAGRRLVDAPVVGSRPQADAGGLVVLAGGDIEALDRARAVLAAFAGTIHHCGPAGSGAVVKLAINDLFATQVAVLGELIGFMRAHGIDPAFAVELLGGLPTTSPAARAAAQAMLGDTFPPAFPIELAEKDLAYVIRSGAARGFGMTLTEAVRERYVEAIAAGFAGDNITGIVRLSRGLR